MAVARVALTLRSLAANVRRRRLALNMTQESFSELTGFDPRFFRFIEQGTKDISLSTLVRLSVALDCSPADLLAPAPPLTRRPGRPRLKR